MPTAEVIGVHLRVPEIDGGFVREPDPWCARLVITKDVGPDVLVRDDLGVREKVGVAAGVVTVMVGVEDVLDRLVSDAWVVIIRV